MFGLLSQAFPICCASDEFYFFPQVVPPSIDWSLWDDFSSHRVTAVAAELAACERQLTELLAAGMATPDNVCNDAGLLRESCHVLCEQLVDVRPHRCQPTFHLTVLVTGLADALGADATDAFPARLAGVPTFLDAASQCLDNVPRVFLELGLDMVNEVGAWLTSLPAETKGIGAAAAALDRFAQTLRSHPAAADFRLPREILDQVATRHMRTGMDVETLLDVVELEVSQMTARADACARRLKLGNSWQEGLTRIPLLALPAGGIVALCRHEVQQMAERCVEAGLVTAESVARVPLDVEAVPASLQAVRAAASYSACPGHPPQGGTFAVLRQEFCDQPGRQPPAELRVTVAHETYPGHHLLDTARWGHPRAVRRSLEHPLFYEGWACFAEQMAVAIRALDAAWDPLIVAVRRIRRAFRARVDLGLQTGTLSVPQAAGLLEAIGYTPERARDVTRKYTLRPAYQLCYTIGQRRFDHLFEQYGQNDYATFTQSVLGEGEVPLDHLEKVLARE